MRKSTTISINNFGPIKQFDFDLNKSFIVTYGDNNIGKSYAMQVMYLLLKSLILFSHHNHYYYFNYELNKVNTPYNDIFNKLKNLDDRIEITDFINSTIVKRIESSVMTDLLNSFNNTFGNFDGIIKQKPYIRIKFDEYDLEFDIKERKIKSVLYSFPSYLKKVASGYRKTYTSDKSVTFYYYGQDDVTITRISEYIESEINKIQFAFMKNFSQVYFLPASRSGIYSGMSAFSSIVAELSKNKAMLSRKIELPGISEPISDYFIMLSNTRLRESNQYKEIYREIEKEILKGIVKYNRHNNTIVYVPDGLDNEFEMTEVSSMVSEISPIVAFLKYIISFRQIRYQRESYANSIVFIEEPEAHLHPQNQIKLIEIFSKLPKFGISLVISSHSNYVFNKLNNLLLSKDLSPDIYEPIILEQFEGGSISKRIDIDEFGATDENFSDVTEKLYEEREAIIEKLTLGE